LVLDEEVLRAVLQHHDAQSASKFIEEVFWRSYFKGWLEHRPDVWRQYELDQIRLHRRMRTDSSLRRRYMAAINANSGITIFDDWAEELRTTGYLHNHARMWFASIWIFTLQLPWQLGARWFHYHLLDGDVASNTLSWRWVAGLHTRGKTYLARPENIQRYAGKRLSAGDRTLARLVSNASPLHEAPGIADLSDPSWPTLIDSDPQPAKSRAGLLLHDEDLAIVTPSIPIRAAAVLAPMRSVRRTASRRVSRFGLGACLDTLARCDDRNELDAEPRLLRSIPAVLRWAREHRLDTLITPYAPVGSLNNALVTLETQADGFRLLRFRRRLDCLAWPHARNGYFGLKKRIPEILENLQKKKV
jgi:deoxyribodipyrimidine photo-lyase